MGDLKQFEKGYRMLAELGYRPAAPSDGHGTIAVPGQELDVDIEAREYARRFEEMDQSTQWEAGCTDWRFAPAAVLAFEAFSLMNAGTGVPADLVPRLLRRAAEEYERAREEDRRTR